MSVPTTNKCSFLLLAIATLALGAPQEQRAKLPPDVEHVLGLARAAQPEFAADALLRLVEGGHIPDAKMRREIVEDAFTLAANASQKLRKAPITRSSAPGSVAYRLAVVNERGWSLDTMSLQVRAIRLLRDQELFRRAQGWQVPPVSCDEPYVWDVSAFYQMVGDLF